MIAEEAPILLRASGLHKAFGGQVVLAGADVQLRQGEVVLLRGENGSGKTTLLNILTGNLEPDSGAIQYLADGTPRSYQFPRHWWQELNPFDHFVPEFVASEGIGRTWQDLRLFGAQTLRENLAVASSGHPGENPLMALIAARSSAHKEIRLRGEVDAVLAQLGLAGREESSADMVSLGQSKRVAIARAVTAGAKILFLDEPLAGLDRQGIADVLSLLKSLVRDEALTLVIVEHVFNQPHLQGLVTTDWLLAQGNLTQAARRSDAEALSSAMDNPSRPPWFHLLAGENAEIIDAALPRGAILTRIRRPDRYDSSGVKVLELRNLVIRRGPRVVVAGEGTDSEGLNLCLMPGEIAIIQAPNGWGKSSLVAAACGLLPVESGEILLCGEAISALPMWQRTRLGLRVLPATGHAFPCLTTKEVARIAGHTCTETRAFDSAGVRKSAELSGGQRQLMALDLFIDASMTKLRILDEPFAMLDNEHTLSIASALASRGKCTMLIVVPSSTSRSEKEPQ